MINEPIFDTPSLLSFYDEHMRTVIRADHDIPILEPEAKACEADPAGYAGQHRGGLDPRYALRVARNSRAVAQGAADQVRHDILSQLGPPRPALAPPDLDNRPSSKLLREYHRGVASVSDCGGNDAA